MGVGVCVCVCVCAWAEPRVVSVWVGVVWAGGVRGAGGGRADAHAPTAKVASLPAPQATHRKHGTNPAMRGGGLRRGQRGLCGGLSQRYGSQFQSAVGGHCKSAMTTTSAMDAHLPTASFGTGCPISRRLPRQLEVGARARASASPC